MIQDYNKYSKDELITLLEYIDRPVNTFDTVVLRLCECLSCDNCPVTINKCDFRTEEGRIWKYEPCYTQLYNWIIKETKGREQIE